MCHDDKNVTGGTDNHGDRTGNFPPLTIDDDARERQQGILTYNDREYLRGEKNLDGPSEIQLRQRLRDRIKNALLDFEYLALRLDEQDISLIFDNLEEPPWPSGRPEGGDLYVGVTNALTFLYTGVEYYSTVDFDMMLERGIGEAEAKKPRQKGAHIQLPTVTVEWNTVYADPDQSLEKLRDGKILSPHELEAVLAHSDLDEDDWERLRELSKELTEAEEIAGDTEIHQGPDET